jgi:hypothetical protein
VTAKEQLQQLTSGLGEEPASLALGLQEPLVGELPEHRQKVHHHPFGINGSLAGMSEMVITVGARTGTPR